MKRGGPIERKTRLVTKTGLARGQFAKKCKSSISASSPRSTLKQGRSTGKPTKAEAERMAKIAPLGCLACRKEIERNPSNLAAFGAKHFGTEVHHLNVGGKHGQKRRGHRYTIGLCAWHHRGECWLTPNPEEAKWMLGPSFFHHAREFRERYGDDDQLLALQDQLILGTDHKVLT